MLQYYFLPYNQIDVMIKILHDQGYKCVAPRYIEDSINYATLTKATELPWGLQDEQAPGHYKVIKTDKRKAFAFTVPVQSIKPMLFKAKENLWKVIRNAEGKLIFEPQVEFEKVAVFGIRACDMRAIETQDRIFIEDSYKDVRYLKRRENQFLIAMNCTSSHSNCFCVSLGDSPKADKGYDLVMTEIEGGFVVETGSVKGSEVLNSLCLAGATREQIDFSAAGINCAIDEQTKTIPPVHIVEYKLKANLEHPRWDDVGSRCLSCGNCTNSCPTCFCHNEREEPILSGTESLHTREWDTCFSLEHSYTHGETYRETTSYRYRQWLTHKFATWRDQFDIKGCVGCGRCITWCPVKIDVTEEINHICNSETTS